MEQKERMDQGLIYDPADNRISTEQTSCLDAQYEFNATRPSEMKKRAALLKQPAVLLSRCWQKTVLRRL